jgi:Lon protease-like protein
MKLNAFVFLGFSFGEFCSVFCSTLAVSAVRIFFLVGISLSETDAWLAPVLSGRNLEMSRLYYSEGSKSRDEEQQRKRERMSIVRSLQTSFYSSGGNVSTSPGPSSLVPETGAVTNLPLWQVNWLELPGRTNVWNVHQAHFTHMLETIVRSPHPSPWYVGHLYVSDDQKANLQAWRDGVARDEPPSDCDVLGTLLRIVDYRRMDDGRLLVLVQALERFVVTEVVQERPYSVAHVQLIPDVEEVDGSESWIEVETESRHVGEARALAISESFTRWHRYEYEQTVLPLPLQHDDLRADQVVGGALAKVLPYAPFSSVFNIQQLLAHEDDVPNDKGSATRSGATNASSTADHPQSTDSLEKKTLEWRLLRDRVLRRPESIDASLLRLCADELEVGVWLALNDFLQQTKKPVSPILLGFLPHNVTWPTSFVLEQVAENLEQSPLQSKYVRLSPQYPAARRQKRLSYTAPALLEHHVDSVHALRRQLLAIPSTRVRLAYVLQLLQDEAWGAFR